jgi:hypothetical protein
MPELIEKERKNTKVKIGSKNRPNNCLLTIYFKEWIFCCNKKLLNPICGLQNLQKLANCSLTRNKNIMHNGVKSFLSENIYLIQH